MTASIIRPRHIALAHRKQSPLGAFSVGIMLEPDQCPGHIHLPEGAVYRVDATATVLGGTIDLHIFVPEADALPARMISDGKIP